MTEILPDPGVYVIVNSANGRRYYGSSVNCLLRRRSHWGYLRRGTHCNSHLQRAWNKYGESAFSFSVVEYCSADSVRLVEQAYLDNNPGGYNIEPNAERSGGIRSSETKKKIAKTLTGMKRSPEEIAKSSEARRGRKQSELTKARVSRGLKRHFQKHPKPRTPKSEEHKRKVSAGMRRYCAEHPEIAAKSVAAMRKALTPEVIARRAESLRATWRTRPKITLTWNGETMGIREWSQKTGIPESKIRLRLHRGLDISRVLSVSDQRRGRKFSHKKSRVRSSQLSLRWPDDASD